MRPGFSLATPLSSHLLPFSPLLTSVQVYLCFPQTHRALLFFTLPRVLLSRYPHGQACQQRKIAEKNMRCPVTFEFQINNKYMHSKNLFVVYLIFKCNWTSVLVSWGYHNRRATVGSREGRLALPCGVSYRGPVPAVGATRGHPMGRVPDGRP